MTVYRQGETKSVAEVNERLLWKQVETNYLVFRNGKMTLNGVLISVSSTFGSSNHGENTPEEK